MAELKSVSAPRSVTEIASYHAHIYYDPAATREVAEQLREWIGERFCGPARQLARREGRPS